MAINNERVTMKTTLQGMVLLAAIPAALMMSGCAAFRANVNEVNVDDTRHMGANYDYSDMRKMTQGFADAMVAEFLSKQPSPPIMVTAGLENRTDRHEDTKLITDRIRDLVLPSGKAQFINESRRADLLKEQGYQAANATPETQAKIGRQLGAKYMISGSLAEMQSNSPRQVRVSKQEIKYYHMTIEVTDLESGLLVWSKPADFAREISKPLIGW